VAVTSDAHRATDQGHSPREDWEIRECPRKRMGERIRVEMPLEEEDEVGGEVRDDGIADVATDFEPRCSCRAD
jgi:hypothetical protein